VRVRAADALHGSFRGFLRRVPPANLAPFLQQCGPFGFPGVLWHDSIPLARRRSGALREGFIEKEKYYGLQAKLSREKRGRFSNA
jgi:hypothetical protein